MGLARRDSAFVNLVGVVLLSSRRFAAEGGDVLLDENNFRLWMVVIAAATLGLAIIRLWMGS